ncbi:MAG: hypothetical protein H8E27_02690 [Verrucomicrobia subdivision 3 bacterium]|nr:hypothetical protein [Limisphaerales bacterium]
MKPLVIHLENQFFGQFLLNRRYFDIGTVFALIATTGVYGRHNPHKPIQPNRTKNHEKTQRFHAYRAVGGDCHYWHSSQYASPHLG